MNRLPLRFALRYLRSRKSFSVINILSRVSSVAVGISVAAMVVLLSVFNGFEDLVRGMYENSLADISISSVKGKNFDIRHFDRASIDRMDGVESVSYVLEESVLLDYRQRQAIARLRGVDSMYRHVIPVERLLVDGEYQLQFGELDQAVVGQGVAYNLGIRTSLFDRVGVYAPRRGNFSPLLPIDAFARDEVFPVGVFSLDAETDAEYIIGRIEFAQKLLNYPDRASEVLVRLSDGANVNRIQRQLQQLTGPDFKVQTRLEQKSTMYRIMKYEKWGVFFITLMVFIIAAFSIVGSLVMLVIDKRNDTRTLINMGADIGFVRRIFFNEGVLISLIGVVSGVVLGVAVCLLQLHFGLVKMGGTTFVVENYPVAMRLGDIVSVVAIVMAVNMIITTFTVKKMIPKWQIRL